MIIGKVIKFGYGDVLLGANPWYGRMTFEAIKPPLIPGQQVDRELYGQLEIGVKIDIYESDCWELHNLFKTVNEDNKIVEYQGYTFDFSNYNQLSVNSAINRSYYTVNLTAFAC